jgi:hypothetical protein
MINKNKIFKSLFASFLVCGMASFSFVFALETNYPEIGGKTINEDSTIIDFVSYFFNLAVVLGTVAAVVMIVYAGFLLVNSRGEPGKISEAKSKITSAFIGLVILLGSFLIVNTINPNIFNVKEIKTECLSGIFIVSSDGTTKTENCLQGSQSNINLGSVSSTEWKSGADTIPKVYVYDQDGYKGNITEVLNGSSIPSGTKSIYFMGNQEGIYLYDSTSYMPKERATPLIISGSIEDLSKEKDINELNYNNIIKSIYFKQPASGIYNAILFAEASYTGTCSYMLNNSTDLSKDGATFYDNKPAIGQGVVSSIEVFKTYPTTTTRGTIILYNGVGCPDSENDQVKKCSVDIPDGVAGVANISKQCSGFVGDVQSMRINGAGGIVLKTSAYDSYGLCELFTKPDDGTCINSIIGSNVYQGFFGLRPQSYIVFPIN